MNETVLMQYRRRQPVSLRVTLLAALVVLLGFIAGCATPAIKKGYDGPKRSDDETALVQSRAETRFADVWLHGTIEKVDGRQLGGAWIPQNVRVLPGSHAFEIESVYAVANSYLHGTTWLRRRWLLTFDVQAGSTYRVERRPNGKPPEVYHLVASGDTKPVSAASQRLCFFRKDPKDDSSPTWYLEEDVPDEEKQYEKQYEYVITY